ncbi:MAG: hypothetical protein HPY59_14040 [Anaerolineae bacterium]|nr:hypothetical protein [Anaerolineae bacterium]
MNHQPFENWILDDEIELSQDQSLELKRHLETCQDCQRLYQNWQMARSFLVASPVVSPPSDFTARWQSSLAEKRVVQHKKQIRKIFLFLIMGILITSAMLVGYAVASTGLANVLVAMIKELVTLSMSLVKIAQVIRPLVDILPPVISAGAWILFTTTFTVMALAWIVAIWQITVKGVYNA